MLAPLDIFKKTKYSSASDCDDGTDAPKKFKSAREERIYLGRGYNRLGLGTAKSSCNKSKPKQN